MTLHISSDRRKGTLFIQGPPGYEGVQNVRIAGDPLDGDAFEVKPRGWDSKPSADFGPLSLQGWTNYGSLTAFVDGEDCELLHLGSLHAW